MTATMRVIVVGGRGNIGTAVVRALVDAGHEVTVFSRGTRAGALPRGVFEMYGDRRERPEFEDRMRRERFDAAVDLACFTPEDAESDLRAFEGVTHLIHTSTIATFGAPLAAEPADESTPLRPTNLYGTEKARADETFLNAHRSAGFPVTVLKPAHTWGPGMPVIRQLAVEDPFWVGRLRAGRPLLLADDGMRLWSVCHSEDAATAYLGLLGCPSAYGETYIVSSPEPVTWVDYHEQIAAAVGGRFEPVFAPAEELLRLWPEGTDLLPDTRWDLWFDVSKLAAAVPSFQPGITLRAAAAEHVAWAEAVRSLKVGEGREDEVLRQLATSRRGAGSAR